MMSSTSSAHSVTGCNKSCPREVAEVAAEIERQSIALRVSASEADLQMLVYLLGMVIIEASLQKRGH